MKYLIFLSLYYFSALVICSVFFKEDHVCDPAGSNWIPFTGYRLHRYASVSLFPEPLRPVHAIELYHCYRGKVNYVATAEVPADSEMAWGVNICGPPLKPGQRNPFPSIPNSQINTAHKVNSKSWWNNLLVSCNPFHQTPISNKIKQLWLSNDKRKNMYKKARQKARLLEQLQMKEIETLNSWNSNAIWSQRGNVQEKAFAMIYSKLSESTHVTQKAKEKIQSLERFLNKGLSVSDERILGAYGYIEKESHQRLFSDSSEKWRGHVIDLIKMSYASIGKDYSEGAIEKSLLKNKFDKSGYRSHGSYGSSPSLSRLSSDPVSVYNDSPEYCFRAVRSKRYYYNNMDFFFPYTTVGGLFLCPAYGSNCTNKNAIPIMPLQADNFIPVSGWGNINNLKTSKLSAKRAREASSTTAPKLLIWLGKMAGTLSTPKGNPKQTIRKQMIATFNENSERNMTTLMNWMNFKIKSGLGSVMSYFDDITPDTISLRRPYVKRVPFLFTKHSDFKPKYMKKGATWPKWAKKLDVNEMYSFKYGELGAINLAVKESVSAFLKQVGVWKQFDLVLNSVNKKKYMDYEQDELKNSKTSIDYGSREKLRENFLQYIEILHHIKQWTVYTVFSSDVKQKMRTMGLGRKKLLKIIKEFQKPWDDLNIDD